MDYNIHMGEVKMRKLALHKVGNKSLEEGVGIAKKLIQIDERLNEVLLQYFINNFKMEDVYEFNHEHDLSMNEIYNFCKAIFDAPDDDFYGASIEILKHLYSKSNHVKIKGGELYVAYFENCVFEDEVIDAIGIFKAENKDTYLKLVLDSDEEWMLDFEQGTNTSRLDKGCIVFNKNIEEGFRVISVDLKSADAKYWLNDFLSITMVVDDRFQTKAYLDLCKSFGRIGFKEEDKHERVDFLNRSKDYFENYTHFEEEEFKSLIFEQNHNKADHFEAHKQNFQEKIGIEDTADNGFIISKPMVDKNKRSFKNNITLDTEMEIKVHSSRPQADGFLERGYDEEKGMKYYKVYFNNEK